MSVSAALLRIVIASLVIAWGVAVNTASAATMHPRSIALLDPLGTGCVDGGRIDDPFPAAKGIRPPPFCLPDPCLASLSREDLAMRIVGRTVSQDEWDAYYSRYAELCRAETILPAPEPRGTDEFWAPLIPAPGGAGLASLPSPAPAVTVPVPLLAAAGGLLGAIPPAGGAPTIPTNDTVFTDPNITGSVGTDGEKRPPEADPKPESEGGGYSGGGEPETPLPVVPLPPSILLLAVALGLLPFAVRRS